MGPEHFSMPLFLSCCCKHGTYLVEAGISLFILISFMPVEICCPRLSLPLKLFPTSCLLNPFSHILTAINLLRSQFTPLFYLIYPYPCPSYHFLLASSLIPSYSTLHTQTHSLFNRCLLTIAKPLLSQHPLP